MSASESSASAAGASTSTLSIKLLLTNEQCGAVIGKRGKSLSALEDRYGVYVSVSVQTQTYPGTFLRPVLIRGGQNAVRGCLDGIVTLLWSDFALKHRLNPATAKPLDAGGHSHEFTVRLLIPVASAGAIIGRKGATLHQIGDETGAYMRLSPSDDVIPEIGERCLIIYDHDGVAGCVTAAAVRAWDCLSSDPRYLTYTIPGLSYPRSSGAGGAGASGSWSGSSERREARGGPREARDAEAADDDDEEDVDADIGSAAAPTTTAATVPAPNPDVPVKTSGNTTAASTGAGRGDSYAAVAAAASQPPFVTTKRSDPDDHDIDSHDPEGIAKDPVASPPPVASMPSSNHAPLPTPFAGAGASSLSSSQSAPAAAVSSPVDYGRGTSSSSSSVVVGSAATVLSTVMVGDGRAEQLLRTVAVASAQALLPLHGYPAELPWEQGWAFLEGGGGAEFLQICADVANVTIPLRSLQSKGGTSTAMITPHPGLHDGPPTPLPNLTRPRPAIDRFSTSGGQGSMHPDARFESLLFAVTTSLGEVISRGRKIGGHHHGPQQHGDIGLGTAKGDSTPLAVAQALSPALGGSLLVRGYVASASGFLLPRHGVSEAACRASARNNAVAGNPVDRSFLQAAADLLNFVITIVPETGDEEVVAPLDGLHAAESDVGPVLRAVPGSPRHLVLDVEFCDPSTALHSAADLNNRLRDAYRSLSSPSSAAPGADLEPGVRKVAAPSLSHP